jgi:hypothetical protein
MAKISARQELTEFSLEIRLGNEAMQSVDDVARMLEKIAGLLRRGRVDGKIMDLNGNSVGHYGLE